ncbi:MULTISPECIES: protease pro-enzyme activation domain-containing protein [Actinomycetes]|uniref:S53 family peptidase n=1 Tax=Actinomycetes TaxID=1760 RepID=UPI0035CAEC24
MTNETNRVPLPGSHRKAPADARRLEALPADERLEVTVVLRPRRGTAEPAAQQRFTSAEVRGRSYLSRDELAAATGADESDLQAVAAFAARQGLTVVGSDGPRRTVRLAGSATELQQAFGVELHRYEGVAGTFRGRVGAVHLPAELVERVQAVLGLDDRPQAATRHRVRPAAQAAGTSVTARQLASLYDFPTDVDGSGQCVGIIELGGGYADSDLQTYFSGLGLPVPTVVAVGVDGSANTPTGDANGADGEVLLDIEVAGAVAPGATIAVYFAPNTDAGFLDAITTALHDSTHQPSVLSISWGAAESEWTAQAATAMDDAFADAARLGVTVCAASGDNGAADRVTDGLAHADFPASSPHVLACGGTRIEVSGDQIVSEQVWNDGQGGASGGGVSDLFPVPDYQATAGVPVSVNPGGRQGRGVPDVSGDADPASGYEVVVDGRSVVIGGTSAVAPLWAGLVALVNSALGSPVGQLNAALYALASASPSAGPVVDITSGSNTVSGAPGYPAAAGWDACTGLGRPDGAALLAALRA